MFADQLAVNNVVIAAAAAVILEESKRKKMRKGPQYFVSPYYRTIVGSFLRFSESKFSMREECFLFPFFSSKAVEVAFSILKMDFIINLIFYKS